MKLWIVRYSGALGVPVQAPCLKENGGGLPGGTWPWTHKILASLCFGLRQAGVKVPSQGMAAPSPIGRARGFL